MYDIAIIGGGPAGLSAAINGAQRGKNVVVFSGNLKNSYLFKAEKITNYLGFEGLSGAEMLHTMVHHANKMGVEITEKQVSKVMSFGDSFMMDVNGDVIQSKSIVVATGVVNSSNFVGETDYLGKGVSYCATCDGNLYKNKDVAVIALSDDACKEAEFLNSLCSSVTYIKKEKSKYKTPEGIKEVLFKNPKDIKINGDKFVESISVGENTYDVKGVFILRDSISPTNLIEGLELDGKFIKVNRQMETNIPMVYAAGDCTGKPLQIAKAVGEGQVAALNACERIASDRIATENTK